MMKRFVVIFIALMIAVLSGCSRKNQDQIISCEIRLYENDKDYSNEVFKAYEIKDKTQINSISDSINWTVNNSENTLKPMNFPRYKVILKSKNNDLFWLQVDESLVICSTHSKGNYVSLNDKKLFEKLTEICNNENVNKSIN